MFIKCQTLTFAMGKQTVEQIRPFEQITFVDSFVFSISTTFKRNKDD